MGYDSGIMSQCDLCGKKAGWLQSRHHECATRASNIEKTLRELVMNGAKAGQDFPQMQPELAAACDGIPLEHFRVPLLQAANDAATQLAMAAPLSDEQFNQIVGILQGLGHESKKEDLLQRRWFGMPYLFFSCTLWHVLNGERPYYDGESHMQFNISRDEYPIISCGATTYAEERTVTLGRTYGGLSVPVGAGVYYQVGRSQGHTVSGLQPLDVGGMLITNQALYFGGQTRNLRISLAHVIRYQPYVDGFGVCESHCAPKVFVPDYSGMDTGWFFFNLLTAITATLN